MRQTFPIVTHHEPPKPHGFNIGISYRLPYGISYRLPYDISYRFRKANHQGLQQPAPLSEHSPSLLSGHAALPC